MQISIPKLCPFQQKNTKLNHPSLIMSRFKNLLLFIFFWRPLNNYLIGVYLNNLIFFSCNPHYSIGLQWLYLPTNQTARNKRWLSTNRQEIFQPNRNSAWSCSVFAGVFFQNIVIMKTMFTNKHQHGFLLGHSSLLFCSIHRSQTQAYHVSVSAFHM